MSAIKLDDLLKISKLDMLKTFEVSVDWDGTASSTDTCHQELIIKDINQFGTLDTSHIWIDGTTYMQQDVLLSTSDVTIATFTNNDIEADSDIEVSVSDWNCVPENVSVAAGTCAVTLPKVDTAATVRVRIYIR